MPYLANEIPLDIKVDDIIKVTILENDPRENKMKYFLMKGQNFYLRVESVSYNEGHEEHRYHYTWGPNGFECMYGNDRAILFTESIINFDEDEVNEEREWFYTDIKVKWNVVKSLD